MVLSESVGSFGNLGKFCRVGQKLVIIISSEVSMKTQAAALSASLSVMSGLELSCFAASIDFFSSTLVL